MKDLLRNLPNTKDKTRHSNTAGKRRDDFLEKCKVVHGDKYDYSKVVYVKSDVKVEIVCKEHGSFWQMPMYHAQGVGCPKCANEENAKTRTKDLQHYLSKAKEVHRDKYDYSKVVFVERGSKVEILCKVHGSFWQTFSSHLQGCGCPKCATVESKTRNDPINRWLLESYKKDLKSGYFEEMSK